MSIDPIVQAVRKIRQDHMAKFDGNAKRAFQDIIAQRKSFEAQGWVFHSTTKAKAAK